MFVAQAGMLPACLAVTKSRARSYEHSEQRDISRKLSGKRHAVSFALFFTGRT
jgi:hypothetical protein